MADIKEIRKEFLGRRAEIDALDQDLASETLALENGAADLGRVMNGEERQRRREINGTRQELNATLDLLARTTLDKLKSSADVDALHRQTEQINTLLEDDLERLKEKEQYAATAAKVMAGLAKATGKVAELVL